MRAEPISRDQARAGWQGIALIAGTYVYFLIFAQFGFLKRLAELGIEGEHLKQVMGAMALGGIVSSLFTPRLLGRVAAPLVLQWALAGCALAAAFTVTTMQAASAIGIALLIGVSLGLLTVTLVSHLAIWTAPRNRLLQVGLGVGIGYFLCNLPPLFTASPNGIAIAAAGVCVAILAASRSAPERKAGPSTSLRFAQDDTGFPSGPGFSSGATFSSGASFSGNSGFFDDSALSMAGAGLVYGFDLVRFGGFFYYSELA